MKTVVAIKTVICLLLLVEFEVCQGELKAFAIFTHRFYYSLVELPISRFYEWLKVDPHVYCGSLIIEVNSKISKLLIICYDKLFYLNANIR